MRKHSLAVLLFVLLTMGSTMAQTMMPPDTWRALELTNRARARAKLPPLKRSITLDAAAHRHANDMATHGTYGHQGTDGSMPVHRIFALGYVGMALSENIAAGLPTATAAVDAWMASEPHRANIMSPKFQEIGLAVVYRQGSKYGWYWVQEFATPVQAPVPAPPQPPSPAPAPSPSPAPTPVTQDPR